MRKSVMLIAVLMGTTAPVIFPAIALAKEAAMSGSAESFDEAASAAKAAMMANPDAALKQARIAVSLSDKLPSQSERNLALLTARWLEGEALMRVNRPLEAKPIIEAALARVVAASPGSKLHADLLKARAAAALVTGDVVVALRSLVAAHGMFRQLGEPRSQAIVLQQIGSIYHEAREFDRALYYYDQAQDVYSDDPALALANHNNRANSLKDAGRVAEAEAELGKALAIAREMRSPTLEVRILGNIASAQVASGKLEAADATARSGLRLAVGSDASWAPFLWGVRAQVALAKRDVPAANGYIEKTFNGVNLATSTIDYRDFHDAAHRIYLLQGLFQPALEHLSALKRLDVEARDVTTSASSALLAARFDAANQKLRITKLKAEGERLEKLTSLSIVGIGAMLVVLGAILAALFMIRRSSMKVKAANVQLSHAANHDALTGLVNRSRIRELLHAKLNEAALTHSQCALILIDLDRFKDVNDSLGHWAGDELLRGVAARLRDLLPPGSYPARLGGDEFGAVVPLSCEHMLANLAEQTIEALSVSFLIGGAQVRIGASIGIAVSGKHGDTVEALTRNADLALYHSKQTGRGRHSFYAPSMTAQADDRRELEKDLRGALAANQFSLAYQPIFDTCGGEPVAYEALLRWQHPTRGNVPPSDFIYIAEEAGIIRQIGDWVIRSACHQAASWPDHVKVAINLSAVQVDAEGLVATVVNALASSGLRPGRLEFEVTESVFLRQGSRSKATLDQLRAIGVALALDDFGTGYSSLGYLQRADFNKIKIDRSFVQAASAGCKDSLAIVQAIVALANSLGMNTTAEGIETEKDRQLAQDLGCSQLQGYLLGRPEVSATYADARLVA